MNFKNLVVGSVGFSFLLSIILSGCAGSSGELPEANYRVLFVSTVNGNSDLFIMDKDGNNQENITKSEGNEFGPAVSPDGKLVAFDMAERADYDLFVMNRDGSGKLNLSNSKNRSEQGANFSSDGSKIAFYSNRDAENFQDHYQIFTVNPDGSEMKAITNTPTYKERPSWSPDGKKIVFSQEVETLGQIMKMNADGSGIEQLTTTPSYKSLASFSPDGKTIVFHAMERNQWNIFTMNEDGSNLKAITGEGSQEYYPNWSPDGRRIIFAAYRDNSLDIYSMNPDGSDQQRLTWGINRYEAPTCILEKPKGGD